MATQVILMVSVCNESRVLKRLRFVRGRGILSCRGGDIYETLPRAARGGQV